MGEPSEGGKGSLDRARAALDLKRFDAAVVEAGRAVAERPTDAAPHGVMAQALLGLGRPAEALAAVEAGLRLDSEGEWLHRLRSFALGALGRKEGALAAADAAVRLDPGSPWPHAARARALADLDDLLKALEEGKAALALAPQEASLHADLAELYAKGGNAAQAAVHYRDSLALDPRQAGVLNNYGVALDRLGREADATLAFKSAMLVDPTMKVALRNVHSSVQAGLKGRQTLAGFWGRYAAWSLFFLCCPPAWVLMPVLYLVNLTRRSLAADKRAAQLSAADPELMRLYEQLERDRGQGRL